MKKYFMILAAALLTFAACNKDDDKSEDKNILEYGGVKYKTVTLSNGQTWMAEPLRYLPEGAKVSDDPASEGIVYAYKFKDLVYSEDGTKLNSSTMVLANTDELIKELGYLYDLKSIFGADVTAENYDKLEGVQGICPAGWHIPTHSDFMELIGYSVSRDNANASAVETNDKAEFYNKDYEGAKVTEMNKGGFNYSLSGYALNGKYGTIALSKVTTSVESLYGYNSAFNYVISSTGYKPKSGFQLFGMMTTFNQSKYPEGRATLGYVSIANASTGASMKTKVQVRCVKDSEKK